jgi:CDP-diacylglycerol--inositol 3-phosphatidyltransferase
MLLVSPPTLLTANVPPACTCLQDVGSRSWLVRVYYSNRIFMGFCCICCEVLYLCCYLLAFPAFSSAWLVPLPLPPPLAAAAVGTTAMYFPGSAQLAVDLVEKCHTGVPVVGVLAALAVPGVLVKQACNWVQLRTAVQQLVEHDQKKMKAQ